MTELEDLTVDRTSATSLRIFVIGDFGSGDRWQAKVAEAMALVAEREPPDFLLSTGDCLYLLDDDTRDIGAAAPELVLRDRFDPYYAPLGTDFYQCLGNHDVLDIFNGDVGLMIDHTRVSPVWRMPAASYSVSNLPPWITIYVTNTNVFGFGESFAEQILYSPEQMDREITAMSNSFSSCSGLKVLVGHHPIFTPGKRTYRYNGDGELLYMRRLRQAVEDCGVHFYLSGHEHHQSHTSGSCCEFVVQGCGGVGRKPNNKHARRPNGWQDDEKVFRFCDVKNGFAVIEGDASLSVRLRFFGIEFDEPADTVHVIYERSWSGLEDFGHCMLRTCQ